MPLRQEVVSVTGQRRGQRIVVPVKKLFAREKRPYGLGMVGRLTNRTYRKRIDSYVKRQIEDMDDHRYGTSSETGPIICVRFERKGLNSYTLSPLGLFLHTGSPLSTCSSLSWLYASMVSHQWASPSTRQLIP